MLKNKVILKLAICNAESIGQELKQKASQQVKVLHDWIERNEFLTSERDKSIEAIKNEIDKLVQLKNDLIQQVRKQYNGIIDAGYKLERAKERELDITEDIKAFDSQVEQIAYAINISNSDLQKLMETKTGKKWQIVAGKFWWDKECYSNCVYAVREDDFNYGKLNASATKIGDLKETETCGALCRRSARYKHETEEDVVTSINWMREYLYEKYGKVEQGGSSSYRDEHLPTRVFEERKVLSIAYAAIEDYVESLLKEQESE